MGTSQSMTMTSIHESEQWKDARKSVSTPLSNVVRKREGEENTGCEVTVSEVQTRRSRREDFFSF